MYSVVMMMALTGGAETPDFGRRGCSGCSSSSGCYSSCSGSYGCSGCSGRRHGHHRRGCSSSCSGSYGCSSSYGCSGSYGCAGSGYGCAGSGYGCAGSGYGCAGSGYGCAGSGYGCAGAGYGCAGAGYGAPVMGTPVVPKKGEKVPMPAPGEVVAPATILVTLPAEAKLLVDGTPTTSTSTERRLVSPALQPGVEYHYTLTAELVRQGQAPVRQTQRITVRAGEETRVPFTFANPAVTASR